MEKDWQALHQAIKSIVENFPKDLSGADDLSMETQQWLGRAFAVVDQANQSDALGFRVACDNLQSALRYTNAQQITAIIFRTLAIAERNSPSTLMGSFIPAGNAFDAFSSIGNILATAKTEILIVDPYMDEKVLTVFAITAPENVLIRLLADEREHKPSLVAAMDSWLKQYSTRPLQVRLASTRILHDRLISIDQQQVWTLTQSLNNFATRSPATIAKLDTETANLKIHAFEDIWKLASPI